MFRTLPAIFLLSTCLICHGATNRAVSHQRFDPDAINNFSDLPVIRSTQMGSAVVRAQVLLSRAHFSVGEIDGATGDNFRHAVKGFQKAHDLPATGNVDQATWKLLLAAPAPVLTTYTITPEDVAGPFETIPSEMADKAKLPKLGYSSPIEGLGEKFHASPALLRKLNPGNAFDKAGVEILVPNVANQSPGKAASVTVSKSKGVVTAANSAGKVIAQYPATVGSEHDPLPIGDWTVTVVKHDPPFFYNPKLFWDANSSEAKAEIAPGPNNPVGLVWIGLSKEHYGIHGTPEPGAIGHAQSHGCIRLTNWDALELAGMVAVKTAVHLTE
jgi:lipoprotein-anchoring transpeptidase ErfK/SrfK